MADPGPRAEGAVAARGWMPVLTLLWWPVFVGVPAVLVWKLIFLPVLGFVVALFSFGYLKWSVGFGVAVDLVSMALGVGLVRDGGRRARLLGIVAIVLHGLALSAVVIASMWLRRK